MSSVHAERAIDLEIFSLAETDPIPLPRIPLYGTLR